VSGHCLPHLRKTGGDMTHDEIELLYLLYVESKEGVITEAQEQEMSDILEVAFPGRDPDSVSFQEARVALGI